MRPVGDREPSDQQTIILIKCRSSEITYILHVIHHYAAQFTNEVLFVSIYEGIGERGALVGGFATPGKLANGDPPSGNGT